MPASPTSASLPSTTCPGRRWERAQLLLEMLVQPRHQLDQVAGAQAVVELELQDLLPAVAGGAGRAGQGEEIGRVGDAADGARLDRGRADLLVGEPAEQLAEAIDLLLEHALEGFRRDVATGHAGAAGRDHDVDFGIGDPGLELY